MLSRGFPIGVVLSAALYLLLIDTLSLPELYAGAGAVLLSAMVSELARRRGLRGGNVRTRALLRVWRPFVHLPADVFWVSLTAIAQLACPRRTRGSLRAVPFRSGAADDGADMTRRALAEGLGSLTPNTIVLGIDAERDLILVHQLRRTGGRGAVDVLGLG
jgi:multisubunit Na+/H+ antiporter MnhE subunit